MADAVFGKGRRGGAVGQRPGEATAAACCASCFLFGDRRAAWPAGATIRSAPSSARQCAQARQPAVPPPRGRAVSLLGTAVPVGHAARHGPSCVWRRRRSFSSATIPHSARPRHRSWSCRAAPMGGAMTRTTSPCAHSYCSCWAAVLGTRHAAAEARRRFEAEAMAGVGERFANKAQVSPGAAVEVRGAAAEPPLRAATASVQETGPASPADSRQTLPPGPRVSSAARRGRRRRAGAKPRGARKQSEGQWARAAADRYCPPSTPGWRQRARACPRTASLAPVRRRRREWAPRRLRALRPKLTWAATRGPSPSRQAPRRRQRRVGRLCSTQCPVTPAECRRARG